MQGTTLIGIDLSVIFDHALYFRAFPSNISLADHVINQTRVLSTY